MKKSTSAALLTTLLLLASGYLSAQMITGVWKGRINRQKAELKIILNGDSLTGTSYYFESPNRYRRYSIKGYFDPQTNEAVWWDDQLIAEKPARSGPGAAALLSRADFNCPGGTTMMLIGKSGPGTDRSELTGDLNLDKTGLSDFKDEWDFIIDNFTAGANDPYLIDSVEQIASHPVLPEPPIVSAPPVRTPPIVIVKEAPVKKPEKTEPVVVQTPPIQRPPVQIPTIEEKFRMRRTILTTEIPVSGDSIELRFYDNAEIDGDSISLFLNGKMIFQHIRLLGTAYVIKLPVADMQDVNELVMVAENLGSIPPNTSFMVALVGEQRYEARLESTEGSSAMVRLTKKR